MADLDEILRAKIKTLNERLWDRRVSGPALEAWLNNFRHSPQPERDTLHALWLLSQFMYFGSREIRVLLRALYDEMYKYPAIAEIRRANGDTLDRAVIEPQFQSALARTRFLGVGNPSESGVHLLYYFRQENSLPKSAFIHSHEIFTRQNGVAAVHAPDVERYVFLDDFCGTGQQVCAYSQQTIEELRGLVPTIQVEYRALFATEAGLTQVRGANIFDVVEALVPLGDSFRAFEDQSRCFVSAPPEVTCAAAKAVAELHGARLEPNMPLGYRDCELLIGFAHNTPDNTLPIIWKESAEPPWVPAFRRYPKELGDHE